MGIRMILPEVNQQTSSVEQMCRSYISSMGLIKTSINAFISEPGIKGKTYDSAKEYFSQTYISLADGIILLSEAMIEAHQQFPQKYIDEVDSNSLDSDILHDQIQRLENMIQSMKAAQVGLPVVNLAITGMISTLRFMQTKMKDKLQRLVAFNGRSSLIFSNIDQILSSVESGLVVVSSGRAWNSSTNTFSTSQINMDWSQSINNKWDQRIKRLEKEAYKYMAELSQKVPNVTNDEMNELYQVTKEVQHVDVPDKLYAFLAVHGETFFKNFKEELTENTVSTVLEAGGEQTKKITQLVRYYAATWGPDGPYSFVTYSTDVAERSTQIIKGANIVSNVGRYGVPVIGGVIDFSVQVAEGEDVGDAAVKASAHVGIGVAGGYAGMAFGATVGSIVPFAGTAIGAATGFVAGVIITAAGNTLFDMVYDNREAIYETITDTVDSIGDTLGDVGDSIINSVEEGIESVGNAIEGFVNGLGTVFG
jgi:hypothetical protein